MSITKAPKILNYKNLVYEKYEFGQPFKQPSGIYQAMSSYRLSKNETLPFYFETPKLKTVSGIVKLDSKYYMDLELPQSGDASSFYNYLLRTDEHNITICHQNSKDWFNQYMPLDVVESFYKSPVILRPNGQLPVMRVRLPSYKGNILTEIYNIKKEKVNDILCIAEDDYIVGIIEFTGLAFMSQSFYPVYELQKIKIFKENEHRTLPTGYIFSDFNEKVDLDKITISVEEERILKEPPHIPQSISNKPMPVISTSTYNPSVPIPITRAPGVPIESTESIDSKSATSSQSIKTNTLNENIEQILKVKELDPIVKISKEPSLFDIVRNNTLKGALLDDDIFMQHSMGIKTAYQQRETNLRKYLENKNKPTNTILSSNNTNKSSNVEIFDKPDIPSVNSSNSNFKEIDSYLETPLVANLQENKIDSSISVLDNIEVEKVLEIDSEPINMEKGTLDIPDKLDNLYDLENQYDLENIDVDSDDNSIVDSDDGMDYTILDDLEVVVFED